MRAYAIALVAVLTATPATANSDPERAWGHCTMEYLKSREAVGSRQGEFMIACMASQGFRATGTLCVIYSSSYTPGCFLAANPSLADRFWALFK